MNEIEMPEFNESQEAVILFALKELDPEQLPKEYRIVQEHLIKRLKK